MLIFLCTREISLDQQADIKKHIERAIKENEILILDDTWTVYDTDNGVIHGYGAKVGFHAEKPKKGPE